jgi:hypothetical protein
MSFSINISETIHTETYKTQRALMDATDVEKLEQAMQVHGYRGKSKGKHNGVVNIKPDDAELWKSLKKFKQLEDKNVNKLVKDNKLTFYTDVKLVAHCPNGNRAIGSLYKNNNNEFILILLGFSNYNYQLFK